MRSMTDRKARLAALAARAGRAQPAPAAAESGDGDAMQVVGGEEASKQQPIKFRNYTPTNPSLEDKKQTDASENVDNEGEEPAAKRAKSSEKMSELELALEKAKREAALAISSSGADSTAAFASGDGDTAAAANVMAATAPKKINWDLKRDLQPKLDKLERRTQRAIVELLRERLEREANQEEID